MIGRRVGKPLDFLRKKKSSSGVSNRKKLTEIEEEKNNKQRDGLYIFSFFRQKKATCETDKNKNTNGGTKIDANVHTYTTASNVTSEVCLDFVLFLRIYSCIQEIRCVLLV